MGQRRRPTSFSTIGAVEGPLALDQPELMLRFREALDEAGFKADRIGEALGAHSEVLSRSWDIPVQLRRLEGRGGLAALIRLFVLNLDVPEDDVATAIAPLGVTDLTRLGIASADGGVVRPSVRIVPHDELLITSDVRLRAGEKAPPDHVPGVHRPSVTLAYLTVRPDARSLLDLGTGCGVVALVAAPHADRVLGTDISPRALRFAAFNAQLNGVRNLELRLGSWFDPVRDERFDVIVCNPPYVISPATEYIYRDSGLPGDSVSEQVVRSIPAHLEEGGFATVAISWIADPDGDPAARVRRWVEGSGCDAWLLHYRTDEPLETAAGWNQTEAGDPIRYAELIDGWMSYYGKLGIRGIAYGSVVLRRRAAGPNWFRIEALPPGGVRPASDHVQRMFAAHDFLARIGEAGLLEAILVPAASMRLEQQVRFEAARPRVHEMAVTLDDGLPFRAGIEPRAVLLLSKLDGRRPLRLALVDAALAEGAAGDDTERFVQAGLPVARRMFELGLLTLADGVQAS